MLWDLAEGKKLYSLEANETIHALCFSPNRYWLCAATDSAIKVGHPSLRLQSLVSNRTCKVCMSSCQSQAVLVD